MKIETLKRKFECHYSESLRTAIPAPSLGVLIDAFVADACLDHPCSRSCFGSYLWTLGPSLLANYANKLENFARTAREIGAELPGFPAMLALKDDCWEAYKQAHHAATVNEFEDNPTIWVDDKTEVPYLQWCRDMHLDNAPTLIKSLLAEESAAY
jgi:hypothetical protein